MYEVFKDLHEKLNDALGNGFFIEAITIEYAIIDNRLSKIEEVLNLPIKAMNFDTRFRTIKKALKSYENGYSISSIDSGKIKNFIKDRNVIIHNLVGIKNDPIFLESVALNGLYAVNYLQNLSKKVKNIKT
jgi:hypothetical protein